MAFAPHSGWAAMVAVGCAAGRLQVLNRSRIDLVDSRFPESKQPYHAVETLDIASAACRIERYRAAAEGMALNAVRSVVDELNLGGYTVEMIGILESAGRKGSSLASILTSHALIHAADGHHFRDALASAGERLGLTVHRVVARNLEREAEMLLRQPLTYLRDTVRDLGRSVGPPWGADQKGAALLALMLVSKAAVCDDAAGWIRA